MSNLFTRKIIYLRVFYKCIYNIQHNINVITKPPQVLNSGGVSLGRCTGSLFQNNVNTLIIPKIIPISMFYTYGMYTKYIGVIFVYI